MGRRSAYWAATHPCHDVVNGGYTCDCGHRSDTVQEHDRHVAEAHRQDRKMCERVLSWQSYRRMFGADVTEGVG